MSQVVFILGAGASRHAGIPLMFDFLDQARVLAAAGLDGAYEKDFKSVFAAISRLQIDCFSRGSKRTAYSRPSE